MPIEEVPTQYKTSDGAEFADKKAAERHEALITARREFEDKQAAYHRALAQNARTADGELFTFGGYSTYYRVTNTWEGFPGLDRVEMWSCRDIETRGDEDHVVVVRRVHERSDIVREVAYRVSDLYAHESHAKRALLAAQEKWLAERAEDVADLRAEIAKRWGVDA